MKHKEKKVMERPVHLLVPGVQLARDVHSEDGTILFNADTELLSNHIEKLHKWSIPAVHILEEVATVNALVDPNLQQFVNTYNQSVTVVRKAFDGIRDTQEVPLDAISATADDIAEKSCSAGNIIDHLYALPPCDDSIVRHSVNVSAIAATIAMWLNYPPEMINAVSLAALLHDVGKSQFSPRLLNPKGPLSLLEQVQYEQHPVFGSLLVDKVPGVAKSLVNGILEHHEREDGSGYPYGLKSGSIHPYAKIIAIADTYDEALTSNEGQSVNLSPYASLETLRHNIDKLDVPICYMFITRMRNFLSGNRVVLTDGQQGTVVCLNMSKPSRSTVRLDTGEVLDLAEEPELRIHHVAR